jgi:hypothetical protein
MPAIMYKTIAVFILTLTFLMSSCLGKGDNRIEEIKEDKLGDVFVNTRAGLCKFGDVVLVR